MVIFPVPLGLRWGKVCLGMNWGPLSVRGTWGVQQAPAHRGRAGKVPLPISASEHRLVWCLLPRWAMLLLSLTVWPFLLGQGCFCFSWRWGGGKTKSVMMQVLETLLMLIYCNWFFFFFLIQIPCYFPTGKCLDRKSFPERSSDKSEFLWHHWLTCGPKLQVFLFWIFCMHSS